MMCKEGVVVYFRVLIRNFPG